MDKKKEVRCVDSNRQIWIKCPYCGADNTKNVGRSTYCGKCGAKIIYSGDSDEG